MTVKAIVTDIEGTTSSISFVHEVLFPYASANLEKFIRTNADEPFITKIIHEVINYGSDGHGYELNACSAAMKPVTEKEINHALDVLQHWIKLDLKIKALKDLQGLIWEEGYKRGDYKGHLYQDAYECLLKWHEQGIPLYIYSSGSIRAQKLLFGYTEYGDLNYLFSGNFDTGIGSKRESQSYKKIVDEITSQLSLRGEAQLSLRGAAQLSLRGAAEAISPIQANEILFLSDIEAELDAASEAGLKTLQLVRPGTLSSNLHPHAEIFNRIII